MHEAVRSGVCAGFGFGVVSGRYEIRNMFEILTA